MNIKYDYNVIIVDEAAKVMEVVYTSAGLRDHHISMPLPEQGAALEDMIEQYAPLYQWGLESAQYETVPLNSSGTIDMPARLAAREAQAQADQIAFDATPEGRRAKRRAEYPTLEELIEEMDTADLLPARIKGKLNNLKARYPDE